MPFDSAGFPPPRPPPPPAPGGHGGAILAVVIALTVLAAPFSLAACSDMVRYARAR